MKKVLLLLSFFFALGVVGVNAQSCHEKAASAGKSCCASKMAKAAADDESIVATEVDGKVTYARKEADQQGNVRFVDVKFDESSNTFVNVAPASMTAGMTKKSCASAGEKTSCAGKAEGKACAGMADSGKACAGMAKSGGKACCASKAAAKAEPEQK